MDLRRKQNLKMNSSLFSRISFKTDLYERLGLSLLILAGLVALVLLPFNVSGDGAIRFRFMQTLVHELQIAPMRYSMIGPLLSFPLWLVGSLFANPEAIISRYNFILFACGLFMMFHWLKPYFEGKFLVTFLLILSFGTVFPGHLIDFYGEVFSAVFLALGTAGLALKKNWLGWIFILLAVVNTPALSVAFALVVMYWTWQSRQLRYLALLPVCAGLIVLESWVRMGGLLTVFQVYVEQDHGWPTVLPYSGQAGYSYPFALGVLSIFLSFGKGLIFYFPGLILIGWVWKSVTDPLERRMLVLWLLIVLGLVVAYAPWWAWYGGWFWGPRFFLFASFPTAWILARLLHSEHLSLVQTLVVLLVLCLSFWVGINGVVFQQNTLDICSRNHHQFEYLCWYVPEFSPLIRPFIVHAALSATNLVLLSVYGVLLLYAGAPAALALISQVKMKLSGLPALFHSSPWRI